ncbi:S-receptor-like serine/threonine-protein kinase [Quillaja saponaria]|uniref:Receptor-like serine/threonine-protein kinase n=1 Tax=Quillaja saponaria TaxID=32244 RepID=A0AAD7PVJ2_QUISA|nr:S-receptor-like serine/threonine-protein kinase [Quillaja saponaria]
MNTCNLCALEMGFTCKYPITLFLFSLLPIFCFQVLFTHAANSIRPGQFIRDGETLVSDGSIFQLGFFGQENTTSRFVGIRYFGVPLPSVVWVANRENPIPDKAGAITIINDGNLVVLDGNNRTIWSTKASMSTNNSLAILEDTGNLILSNSEDTEKVYWQSFENPTDTYLPNMRVRVNAKMGENRVFTSWKSETDPSPGNYTMGVDPQGSTQIVIWEGSNRRWRSGYWDRRVFTGVPNMTGNYLFGFELSEVDDEGSRYFTYTPLNISDKIRFQLTWDGYEKQFRWTEGERNWGLLQSQPGDQCDLYDKCGSFGVCSANDSPKCSCMKGFVPKFQDQWNNGNWSSGCRRKTPLMSQRNSSHGTEENVGEDGFFAVRPVKVPDFANLVSVGYTETCKDKCLQNSSCTAYAEVNGIGCLVWNGDLLDVKYISRGQTLLIRLASSDLESGNRKLSIIVIILIVLAGIIFLVIFIWLVWRFKKKLKASCSKDNEIGVFDVVKSKEFSADFSGSAELHLEGNEISGPELPLFNFNSVVVATNNFCEENKLGQGGFGPVYKGKLPGGQAIAVKRLSGRSGQGLEEFKNEIILIAKLQHRNLVRLLGCCIQGEEKMLIYEYLPNKSLDYFIFDQTKKTLLDWKKRFTIIEGIARGLLYLHRDSRLRIIHRDLKASNILLDEDMNPKISDFGLARIFGGNQNEANTNRVVGTYGYMSPEYAMEGLFSVKSDVYSFGVLLLEILSGRKNSSFRSSEYSSLVGHAWHLWNEGKTMELIDPSVRNTCSSIEVLRCIHIALLCVQDSAVHRPDMPYVVLMLESEATTLPAPRPPTSTSMRTSVDRDFSRDDNEIVSSYDLTVTVMVGR